MSKKYKDLAEQIIKYVGGKENVNTLGHCQTRIRFTLKDETKMSKSDLVELDGVINIIESGGQIQVVIGPHVTDVYDEVAELAAIDPAENGEVVKKKQNPITSLIDFISGTFNPLIPAIAGSGMLKALLALLVLFNVITNESQTYYVLNFMADSVFYFFPFLIAGSAAQKIKANPYVAMVLAGVLLHPNLVQLITAGEAVNIFFIPMRLVSYGSSVVPILLIVWLQKHIEKVLNKIVPSAVKILFVPLITILISGVVGLTLLGPVGSFVGDYLAIIFGWMNSNIGWATTAIFGGVFPILVMFGIHHSIVPLSIAQFTTMGTENILGPGALISNIAQGIASLVVAFRTKDKSLKQIASSSGITALMGITEPALYGVTLPKKYPLVAAMIGGASGGLYAGVTGVVRYATGASGLPAIPLYIGEEMRHVVNICIALVITTIVTAVVTFALSLKFEKNDSDKEKGKEANEKVELVKSDNLSVISPVKGNLLPLSEIKDEVFSKEMIGKVFAIEPNEGIVRAPFNGTVTSVFPTKHAIGLLSDSGVELLIHIGINTVELQGEYFDQFVEVGQEVTCGERLIKFNLAAIKDTGLDTCVLVVITNWEQFQSIEKSNCEELVDDSGIMTVVL